MKHGETAPAMPKTKPEARISWPAEGIKLSGDYKALGLGKKARFVIEGAVVGWSMGEYGCSAELRPTSIRVDAVGKDDGEEGGDSMAEMIGKLGRKKKE